MKTFVTLICIVGIPLSIGIALAQTDEEIRNIPATDIIKTQQHAIELLRDALNTAKNQGVTLGDAIAKNNELQGKIDQLAIRDQNCSIDNAKKDARIWKDNAAFVVIGVAVAGYLFLKFYMRLPI